jgi:hypothetical protein
MSFGANNTTKTAQNNLSGTSNLALNNLFPAVTGAGSSELSTGGTNVASGTNFLNTVLGGNQANTTAALAPSIGQIQQGTSNNLNAINTLTPRGGGRSGALFSQSFQPQGQIQSLFNNARMGAATALPQIGLQQQQLGTNLFGIGSNALSAANGANSALSSSGLSAQQLAMQQLAGLGGGLFSLATTPFGGGTAANGLLGLIGSGGGYGSGGGVTNNGFRIS